MAPTTGPPKVLGLSDKGPGPGWSLRRRGTWSLAEMLGAHPNSRCGMKQLAMAGSALGVGGGRRGQGEVNSQRAKAARPGALLSFPTAFAVRVRGSEPRPGTGGVAGGGRSQGTSIQMAPPEQGDSRPWGSNVASGSPAPLGPVTPPTPPPLGRGFLLDPRKAGSCVGTTVPHPHAAKGNPRPSEPGSVPAVRSRFEPNLQVLVTCSTHTAGLPVAGGPAAVLPLEQPRKPPTSAWNLPCSFLSTGASLPVDHTPQI